ncbi:hypothetical protein [Thermosphaera aggregans]|uniref:Uncharacterized protein n=1 Tax=Thermosphaera aggregans (strain DSM 11486 / M11TL) TaxID=633148 RepID=D5U298_THEAM|nr:hypothetical protein [Thermosphaera aggregans]ADG91248.1 hypothetical protein Tagg_0978 [Thermosphaera aggregans DSM 11486]
MNEGVKAILVLMIAALILFPLAVGKHVGNHSQDGVEPLGLKIPIDDHPFASYTIEPNLVYYGGKYYTSILNITQGSYIEGNITFFMIDPATGQVEKRVLTDNLGVDNYLVLAGDKLALAYTRFSNTTYYRDLSLLLLDPVNGSVLANIPVAHTLGIHDEYPVVAYNPLNNMLGIAHFMSNTSYRGFALSILDLSTQTVVKTYLVPPNTTLTYTGISFNIAPLGDGFLFLYVNDTSTPGEIDLNPVFINMTGVYNLPAIPTPGANETLGDIIWMRAPNYTRTDAIYSSFMPVVISSHRVLFTGYTVNADSSRSVFIVEAKMVDGEVVLRTVTLGQGHYPSIAVGSSTIALAYSSPGAGGYDIILKVLDIESLNEIAMVNLSRLAGTYDYNEAYVKIAYSPMGYYIVAWGVLNNGTYVIVAGGIKERSLGFTGLITLPTTSTMNATTVRIGVDGSDGFAILYREYKIATNESNIYMFLGKIGVDLPPITETTTITETVTTTTTLTTTSTVTETATTTTTITETTTSTTVVTETTTTTSTATETITETTTQTITSTATTTTTITTTTLVNETTTTTTTETHYTTIPTTVTSTITETSTVTETSLIPTTTTIVETSHTTITQTIRQTITDTVTNTVYTTVTETETQTATRTITSTEWTTSTKTETYTTSILETSTGVAGAIATLVAGFLIGWLVRRTR